MEKKKAKNKFDLYSEDERINSLLLNMKSKPKIYSRIITSLSLLGKFSKKTDVELFDIISDNENEKILSPDCYCHTVSLLLFKCR